MGGLGIKLSQKGYNVDTAADYQLAFSSEWPLLKIEAQGSFTISNGSVNQTIVTHSLGYNPMFWVTDTSETGRSYSVGRASSAKINATELAWRGADDGKPSTPVSGYYYIFRYNMRTNFTAEIIETVAAPRTIDGNFGLKVSKPNKDVKSTDLRDFVVTPECLSPQIHKTQFGDFTGPVFQETITHNLGYYPIYFFYIKDSTGYYKMISALDQQAVATATTTTVTVSGVSTPGSWFVAIFKDPYYYTES
jgi:hypothetical protein